jgi:predicted pyridoxine 5'-phosphate oxidase superfamily flavin-nucleotide-binding protein
MDIRKAIHELRQEQERLDALIAALEARQTGPRSRRGRKSVPPEERAQVSKRMTAYWAARRAQRVTAAATMSETGPPSPQAIFDRRLGRVNAFMQFDTVSGCSQAI